MIFETLLCILLYLSAIVSPGSYSYQDIAVHESQNQQAINAIHADPALEQSIVTQYSSQIGFLDIYDNDIEN